MEGHKPSTTTTKIIMPKTTIFLWTSARTAILNSIQHGWTPIKLDTSTLAQEERELLADSVYEDEGARYKDVMINSLALKRADFKNPSEDGLLRHLRDTLVRIKKEHDECSNIRLEIMEAYKDLPINQLSYDLEARFPITFTDAAEAIGKSIALLKISEYVLRKFKFNQTVPTITGRQKEFDTWRAEVGLAPCYESLEG